VTDLVKVVNEGINMSESVSATLSLTFELYDPLYIGGTITNTGEIMFTQDTSDPKYITGFVITVVNPSKKKVNSAIRLGNRTVNYLSAKTGVAVRSKRPKVEKQAGTTVQPTNTPKERDFDLDASKLPSLFSGNPLLNKKVANYQSGMTALEDNDPEKAVPKFHQVIEKSGLKDADYYQPFRDACSHHVLDNGNAVNALIHRFGIKCRIHEPVDFTDPDNWRH
jgi:hypothetical protein